MIAVDALGGDFAPGVVLAGALQAAKHKRIPVILFGPERTLATRLASLDACWRTYPIQIIDASDVIAMDEEPVNAVRKKRDASLVKAVASVAAGECYIALSAGNSGAMMVAARLLLGNQPGIERAAIAGLLPSTKKRVLALDLGANADCKPHHLLQFAQLGVAYATDVLGRQNPSVALLCNGIEDAKGSLLTKQAFELLKNSTLDFVGNREPDGVFNGDVDVLVCDGFSGNILLKTIEAVGAFCKKTLIEQSGALLLGVKKPVIIAHGNASSDDITRAICFANEVIKSTRWSKYK